MKKVHEALLIILMLVTAIVSSNTVRASGSIATTYYFLPQQKDEVLKFQHDLITTAKKKLDVAMYGLTSSNNNSYATDLLDACKRGIQVRLLRDQLQSSSKASSAINLEISKFKNCEVRLKKVVAPIMHSKVTIVDGTKVFWGSLNESGSGPAETNIMESNSSGTVFEKAFEDWWKNSISLADFLLKSKK
jgi:HKD family nuclease